MKKIVFSTIMRDCEKYIQLYYDQLLELNQLIRKNLPEYLPHISVYESDSIDNTPLTFFNTFSAQPFCKTIFTSELNNFRKFGSVKEVERVINLAWCRNKTINQLHSNGISLRSDDIVVSLEPDIKYDPKEYIQLISDFIESGNDIRSGIIVSPTGAGSHISESQRFYDTWALRIDDKSVSGDIFEDFKENPIRNVWATYSGFCVYNADFFVKGGRFGYFNYRFNAYDCDTTVICENFRALGYNNIVMDQSKVCEHL